eukprot:10276966-Heterocapsa_arctica.AAC.1
MDRGPPQSGHGTEHRGGGTPRLCSRTYEENGIVSINPELEAAKHKAEHAAEWSKGQKFFTGK